MSCTASLELPQLLDYWVGELGQEEAERLEEHLFACTACTERLESIAGIEGGVRALAGRGKISLLITRGLYQDFVGDGLVFREYPIPAGGSVECTIGAADHFGISWLLAELAEVERVDLAIANSAGLSAQFEDVPFDRELGRVGFAASGDLLRSFPSTVISFELTAIRADGGREATRYTMVHTPP